MSGVLIKMLGFACIAAGGVQAYRIYTNRKIEEELEVETLPQYRSSDAQNIAAFLWMIRKCEGTSGADGYSVCFGYKHTIQDFSDHPANTGEWKGEKLSDTMCRNAGFSPGCVSTAAGAYQITKSTWNYLRIKHSGLPDFSAESQDKAASFLIYDKGALDLVKQGKITEAINKCSSVWASLPGSTYKQPTAALESALAYYEQGGGILVA